MPLYEYDYDEEEDEDEDDEEEDDGEYRTPAGHDPLPVPEKVHSHSTVKGHCPACGQLPYMHNSGGGHNVEAKDGYLLVRCSCHCGNAWRARRYSDEHKPWWRYIWPFS